MIRLRPLPAAAVLVLLTVCFTDKLPAQDSREAFSLGASAGIARTLLNASFGVDSLDGGACGLFETGSGSGLLAGLLVELPLNDRLRLSLAPLYADRSGQMRFPCVDPANTRLPDGSVVPARTDFVADVRHTTLTARLSLNYRPIDLPLYIGAGLDAGVSTRWEVRRSEEIVSPSQASFLSGGGQVRNLANLPGRASSPVAGLLGHVQYRLPAGTDLEIIPELEFAYHLNNLNSVSSLQAHQLRGLISILYRVNTRPAPRPDTPVVAVKSPPPDTVEPELVLRSGTPDRPEEEPGDTLVLTRTFAVNTQLHPLLPYLFFETGSSELRGVYQQRTVQQSKDFSQNQSLKGKSTLDIYYNVLDIIGLRMKQYPDAELTITGTQPEVPSAASLSLSAQRAGRVRDYLKTVWGIQSGRLKVVTRRDPATPSSTDTPDGLAENRRVELSSNRYEVTGPVVLTDTIWSIQPMVARARTMVRANTPVWRQLQLRSGTELLATKESAGAGYDTLQYPVLSGDKVSAGIQAELRVSYKPAGSAAGATPAWVTRQADLPVRYSTQDIPTAFTGSYSLILFDFDKSTLRAEHFRTIEFINQQTKRSTRLDVFGYTDRLGEAERNRSLSGDRAQSVASKLTAPVGEVSGRGESVELYDNNVPEGRFYCRSVTIVVR